MNLWDNIQLLFGKNRQLPPSKVIKNPQRRKKILIIEDDLILQNMYLYKFEFEGFDVLQAENGKTGLEMIISQKPDIILLDLMMPVMDGTTMLHKLRQLPEFKSTPVIIITNAGQIENAKETLRYYDANDFLIKSNITPEELVKKVKNCLGML